jgi:hypothetical protein
MPLAGGHLLSAETAGNLPQYAWQPEVSLWMGRDILSR